MNSAARLLVINIIVVLVVALGTGYLGYRVGLSQKSGALGNSSLPQYKIGPDSIIKNQRATAQATITAADDKNVTIQGDDGTVMVLKLSPQYTVSQASSASTTSAQPSQPSKEIKLNQKAIITLFLEGNEYKVTSIAYPPTSLGKP